MVRCRRALIPVVAAAVWGCAPAAPAPATGAPSAAPDPSYRGFPVAMPPLVTPALAPYFERVAAQLDPRGMYFWQEQSPPAGFRPFAASGFPGRAFVRARGYEFAGDRMVPRAPILDGSKPGCGAGIVARDGTFCPSVRYPGLPLSNTQAAELVAIVTARNDVPRVVMNGFGFDFGFVLFDAADVPVAQVLVDGDVTKILPSPATSPERVDYLSPERRLRLRALLDTVGAPPPLDAELQDAYWKQRDLDGELGEARVVPSASGVDPALGQRDLAPRDRARLCAWQQQVYRRGLPRSGDENRMTCPDGRSLVGTDFAGCQRRFPSCDESVGAIEACMRRQRFDPCLVGSGAASCQELWECFWGMTPAPEQRRHTSARVR